MRKYYTTPSIGIFFIVPYLNTSWKTGIPKDLQANHTWYMETPHGNLANFKPKFNAIFELLERGDTSELSKGKPPILRSKVEKNFPFLNDEPEHFPDLQDLQAAALGYLPETDKKKDKHRVNVWVTNGDLSKAKYPVAVGHFKGDGIISAEAALDHFMDKKLS